ncbi:MULTISPECIES: AI-2E family transporter [unclassified Serratia (in: enterobacteria)]|uniref:AI-2E family transporter n=1 Tax=unclassified Serratia (in: enterobacteria) TaxID=2647522 RepID=UPI0005055E56|nr:MULTISPECIES: AI-2E family transporter [unclassified Serratia (in: enterobacteria)]KFK96470.1 pheromone autoinducer 2 transporter [Serratia sp. Ag2]KFK99945.1 pheromone autoinducer 2 transporter [Serratia sp. Ag1]
MGSIEFNDRKLRLIIMLAMLVVILAGIKAAADIVVPFLLAVFLAIVLNPLVVLLERCRVPRGLSVMLLVMTAVVLLMMFVSMLASSLNEFARSLPQYRGTMLEKIAELQYYAQRFNMDITFSVDAVVKLVDPGATMNLVTRLLGHLSGAMTSIFLLLMTVVFMLFEVQILPYKLRQALNKPNEGMAAIQRALQGVTHYLVIKTVISLGTGLIVWGFLTWVGVRFAFIWGMMAFMFNFVPNIGSVIAAIPPLIQALLFNGFGDAMVVAGGYIVINLVIGNILEPRIMGRGLGLSTLVVFLSLIFWGWLMGPVGMLLSVPLTIIARITLETMDGGQKWAVILGDGRLVKEDAQE